MDDYSPYDQWSVYFDPQAYAAANFDYSALEPASPSDAKLTSDVTDAKATADATGNTKLSNTLDSILKYGDQVLSILTKNGVLKNQNLVAAYPSYAGLLGTGTSTTDTKTDTTNKAPDTSNRVFNIDFTDPKVLIITFLLLLILFYFLFFNKSKNGKR